MQIAFLTTDDPLYLPLLFDRVLDAHGNSSAVFVVPPLYKEQTTLEAALRYYRSFGAAATWQLAVRTIGAKLQRQSIARVCAHHGVPCESVSDVNDESFLARLQTLGTELIVSVSCPQIFKTPLIELPPKGCLNVHGAILPAYRGVLPSFWMLANGETHAGVSVFFVNDDIDAGELCGQRRFAIHPDETLDGFLRRSKCVAAELLLDVLRQVQDKQVVRTPIDLTQGSYYSWPSRDAVRRFREAGRRLW
jgi:methionyl-tRNA formyltransferase